MSDVAAPPRGAPADFIPAALQRALVEPVPATWIDLAKALASQLIVWHHLSLYGPMCDVARSLAPTTLALLNERARLVVQVFLVVGASSWPAVLQTISLPSGDHAG